MDNTDNSATNEDNANFSCKFCDKGFRLKISLSQHLRKKHGQAAGDKINLKPDAVLSRYIGQI